MVIAAGLPSHDLAILTDLPTSCGIVHRCHHQWKWSWHWGQGPSLLLYSNHPPSVIAMDLVLSMTLFRTKNNSSKWQLFGKSNSKLKLWTWIKSSISLKFTVHSWHLEILHTRKRGMFACHQLVFPCYIWVIIVTPMLFMLLFRTQDEARRWHPCNIIYLSKLRAPTLYRTTSSMTIYNSQTKIDSHRTELQTSILLPYLKGQEEHTNTHTSGNSGHY